MKDIVKDARSKIIFLLFLLLLVALAFVISTIFSSITQPPPQAQSTPASPSLGEAIRNGTAPPPLSTSTRQKLTASHGFQALVSYTDNGFEPRSVKILKGQTVRFTNNSSHDVWIAASSEKNIRIYPRTQDICGSSDLDSCGPIAPQDFWEFTFNVPGTWEVVNQLDKSRTGIVIVE